MRTSTESASVTRPGTSSLVATQTSASGSQLASNRLLSAIIYPDGDDPEDLSSDGPDSVYDRVMFRYNRLGQLTSRKDQREVVQLSFIEGLSHQEISDATGVPLGTVKSRLRLSFEKLRHALGDLQ